MKVVFHQTAVPVTPLSTWIIYPKRSALGHSTRCLSEAWLSEVDSIFSSRCRTCCPIDKKGAGAAATWTPSFLLLPALSRAEPEFDILLLEYKGQAKPEGCYPNRPVGGTRRGSGNHTTAVEKACSLQITRTVDHPRPSSFSMKKKFYIDLRKRFPSPAASPLLRRAFPLMVGGRIPLSELGGHSFQPYSNGGGGFEHRLKHDLKVLATPCVQYKIWKAARMTKRGRFPVLH